MHAQQYNMEVAGRLDFITSSDFEDSSDSSDESGEEYVDGGGNERLVNEQLSSLPPLVLISSTVKRYKELVRLANPGVATIHYNHQTTTLTRLLQYIRDRLSKRKAYSICFVTQSRNPGTFKLNAEKVWNLTFQLVSDL